LAPGPGTQRRVACAARVAVAKLGGPGASDRAADAVLEAVEGWAKKDLAEVKRNRFGSQITLKERNPATYNN